MPHLKAIRIANVHFNNATQFYDDFLMKVEGKNATYDLENGGGKSLLILMLLQTVLPKSFLRKEKPISLMFQGGKERTSHVAVEWILEEGSQYKYMLTGFCARKKKSSNEPGVKESGEEDETIMSGDIEHLNWCVFYNDHRITGINSAPLCREESGKKVYANFDDIRKYIQQMKQRGLPADVFDRIDKYQSFISAQNLITAEWNIIKGINSGENNIESYFRQNATSRKLIENQFVKIIEDVEAQGKVEKNSDETLLLADTLIEIRERLNEYLKLKGHMGEFEKIKNYYSDFAKRNDELLVSFSEYEDYKIRAFEIRNFINKRQEELEKNMLELKDRIEFNIASEKDGIIVKKELEAGRIQFKIEGLEKEKADFEVQKNQREFEQKKLDERYYETRALEAYGDYRKIRGKLNEALYSLDAIKNDGDDLSVRFRTVGGKFKNLVNKQIFDIDEEKKKVEGQIEQFKLENKSLNESLKEQIRKGAEFETEIKSLKGKEETLSVQFKEIQHYLLSRGEMEAFINSELFLEKLEEQLIEAEKENTETLEKIKSIESEKQKFDLEKVRISGEITRKENDEKREEKWLLDYQNQFEQYQRKAKGYGVNNLHEYKESLELFIHKESINKLEQEVEIARLQQKKQLSEKNGYYVPNEEVIALTEFLSSKCEFVKPGIEWLYELNSAKKRMSLNEMPLLPFAVIVDKKSFEKISKGKIKIDFTSDYSIPIVNLERLRENKELNRDNLLYFCSFEDLVLDSDCYKKYSENLEAKIENIGKDIETSKLRIDRLNIDYLEIASFLQNYHEARISEVKSIIEKINIEIEEIIKLQKDCEKEKNRLINEETILNLSIVEMEKKIKDLKVGVEKLNMLIQLTAQQNSVGNELGKKKNEHDNVRLSIRQLEGKIDTIEGRLNELQEEQTGKAFQLRDLNVERDNLQSFYEIENEEVIEVVRAEYNALKEAIVGKTADESRLRNEIDDYKYSLAAIVERTQRDCGKNLLHIEDEEKKGPIITNLKLK